MSYLHEVWFSMCDAYVWTPSVSTECVSSVVILGLVNPCLVLSVEMAFFQKRIVLLFSLAKIRRGLVKKF